MTTKNQKSTEYVLKGNVISDELIKNPSISVEIGALKSLVQLDAGLTDMLKYDNAIVVDIAILGVDAPTIHFVLRFTTAKPLTYARWESFGYHPMIWKGSLESLVQLEGNQLFDFSKVERMHIAVELLMHQFEFLTNDEEQLEVFPVNKAFDQIGIAHLTPNMYGTVTMADTHYVDVRVDDGAGFPRFYADIDPVYGSQIRELTAEQALELGNQLKKISARIKDWESIIEICKKGGADFQRMVEFESRSKWFAKVLGRIEMLRRD